MDALEVAGARQGHPFIGTGSQGGTQQPDGIAGFLPSQTGDMGQIMHQTHHAHHGSGMDGLHPAIGQAGLVVEGDIATGDRGIQGRTGRRQTPTGHGQLPIARGGFGGGEIEVVGNRQGFGPHAAQVAGRFSHRRHATPLGIEVDPAVRAIHHGCHATGGLRHGPCPLLGPQAHHGRIGAPREHHGVGLHLVVVLAVNPALAGNGGIVEQLQQNLTPALAREG